MNENVLSQHIINAAIEVHKELGGPGLLESVYEEALVYELRNKSLFVETQIQVPLIYKNRNLKNNLRLDVLVDKKVIVEIKAVSEYNSIFETQLLTYLRMTKLKLGLVINFGEKLVKDGIKRVVNGL